MDGERLQMLSAMGVDVYVARGRDISVADNAAWRQSAPQDAQSNRVDPGTQLVVVCARGVRSEDRLAALFKQLPRALGVAAGSIQWLEADAQGVLDATVEAPGYLVFGAAMARALGAQLSTMQQNAAVIAVTAEPAQLPGNAMQKRAMWQVLKPLAQRLRAQGS